MELECIVFALMLRSGWYPWSTSIHQLPSEALIKQLKPCHCWQRHTCFNQGRQDRRSTMKWAYHSQKNMQDPSMVPPDFGQLSVSGTMTKSRGRSSVLNGLKWLGHLCGKMPWPGLHLPYLCVVSGSRRSNAIQNSSGDREEDGFVH